MAIVADLSGNSPVSFQMAKAAAARDTDYKLESVNRTRAGTPIGNFTPQYSGEMVRDSTNRLLWVAVGTTNADWVPAAKLS